jgi:hypothetical protein
MSEAAAIAAIPSAAPAQRPLRDVDLYAEGNSFAESDGLSVERLFGKDGIGFKDLLDIVNPLQHLPVVGTIYRALTGDALAPGSRILGGTLFGGIGGFVTSLVNAVVENETGSDFGDKALALFQGDAAPEQRLAAATVVPASPAAKSAAASAAASPADRAPNPVPGPATDLAHKAFPIFAGPPRSKPAAQAVPVAHKGTEDPTEALIRARAAVPATNRAATAGLPPSVPVAAKPPAGASGATLALAGTEARKSTPPPDAASPPAASADAATPDIAFMMRDALDKYEALMKGRSGPSISGEF